MENTTILEFNEEQQCFHYNNVVNNIPQDTENRLGWKTLLVCKNFKQASAFADFLQRQFLIGDESKAKAKFDELESTVNNLTGFIAFLYPEEVEQE